jgi:hypothetical protein
MQVEFALRAEIEGRVCHGAALGACNSQGLPHQEIDDEPNGIGDEDHQHRPQGYAHSPSSGITVHITDEQHEESECHASDEADKNAPG